MLNSAAPVDRSTLPARTGGRLRGETLLPLVMLAAVLAAGPWAVYRASVNGGSDFPEFRDAGQFVVEHGTRHPRSSLYRYLPSLDVACIPLTWIPIEIGAAVWYAVNIGCWFGMLKTI